MCNWYEYDLAEWEVRELVKQYTLIGRNWRAPIEVFPNQHGEVVVHRGDECALEYMLWGFTPWIKGRWLTNFHDPELEPWKPLVEDKAQRCVVPATSFSLPCRNAIAAGSRWFVRPNHKPFMFAGVWTKWYGERGTTEAPNVGEHRLYSIMTTEANALVQPIDKAMPVILTTADEVEQWLMGSLHEALALQKPAANDVLKLLPEEMKAA
jgi:putative SOS response-associated peptidase YedK